MFKINALEQYICSDEPYHCIYSTKIILRKIKSDCLAFYDRKKEVPCV